MLNREDLIAIFPRPKAGVARAAWDGYVAALTSAEGARLLQAYGITTPLRMVHLLGTFGAENSLALVWESGAYTADGVMRVFGRGRHSAAIAPEESRRIAALPVEERTKVLFERVYGSGNPKKARELGNTQPGDGWRFRGWGLNQLTGRQAHEAAARKIGVSLEEMWTDPLHMIHAALIEWTKKNCNAFADKDDAVAIRKLINGGSLRISVSRINGLAEALDAVRRAKRVITAEDFQSPPAATAGAVNSLAAGGWRTTVDTEPPATIVHSTETQAAGMVGGSGVFGLFQSAQAALGKATSTGQFDGAMFFWSLLSDPAFMGSLLTVLGAAYWIFKRWARFSTEGK